MTPKQQDLLITAGIAVGAAIIVVGTKELLFDRPKRKKLNQSNEQLRAAYEKLTGTALVDTNKKEEKVTKKKEEVTETKVESAGK